MARLGAHFVLSNGDVAVFLSEQRNEERLAVVQEEIKRICTARQACFFHGRRPQWMLFNPTISALMSSASFVAAEAAPTGRIPTDLNLPNV